MVARWEVVLVSEAPYALAVIPERCLGVVCWLFLRTLMVDLGWFSSFK